MTMKDKRLISSKQKYKIQKEDTDEACLELERVVDEKVDKKFYALDVSDSKAQAELPDDVTSAKLRQLTNAALVVSWISVVFSFCTGVAAIVIGTMIESESLFGYGLDSVLDSFSSVAVLWRFYGPSSSAGEARERKACIVISIFFFAASISLIVKSSQSLAKGDREEADGRLLEDIFCSCCGVITLVLATLKVYLGLKLQSQALVTDSIITYVGAAMSFLGVLGLEVYTSDDSVWYLDAIFGLLCGVFLLGFGCKLLIQMTCCYHNNHQPIDASS